MNELERSLVVKEELKKRKLAHQQASQNINGRLKEAGEKNRDVALYQKKQDAISYALNNSEELQLTSLSNALLANQKLIIEVPVERYDGSNLSLIKRLSGYRPVFDKMSVQDVLDNNSFKKIKAMVDGADSVDMTVENVYSGEANSERNSLRTQQHILSAVTLGGVYAVTAIAMDWKYAAMGAASAAAATVFGLFQNGSIQNIDRGGYGIKVPCSSSPVGWKHGRAFSDDPQELNVRGHVKICLEFNVNKDKLPSFTEANDPVLMAAFGNERQALRAIAPPEWTVFK